MFPDQTRVLDLADILPSYQIILATLKKILEGGGRRGDL